MSKISRRELVQIAMAVTAAGGAMDAASAQHVHQAAEDERVANAGVFKPKAFTDREYATLLKLAELIVPADDNSPSALECGAGEFIDLLSSNNVELASIYTGGLAWLDREMLTRYNATFLNAEPAQRTAMLDLIAYRKNGDRTPELLPGIAFFTWARLMVVDAFYSSKAGVKDLDYTGNTALTKFEVPPEVLDYVIKHSPV